MSDQSLPSEIPLSFSRLQVEYDWDSDEGGNDYGSLYFSDAASAREWMIRECRGRFLQTGEQHLFNLFTYQLASMPLETIEQGVSIHSDGEPLFEVTPIR